MVRVRIRVRIRVRVRVRFNNSYCSAVPQKPCCFVIARIRAGVKNKVKVRVRVFGF